MTVDGFDYGPWGDSCLGLHQCMRRKLDPWSMSLLQEVATERWQERFKMQLAEAEKTSAAYRPALRKSCEPLDDLTSPTAPSRPQLPSATTDRMPTTLAPSRTLQHMAPRTPQHLSPLSPHTAASPMAQGRMNRSRSGSMLRSAGKAAIFRRNSNPMIPTAPAGGTALPEGSSCSPGTPPP
eukprot:TRINITY_DN5365_c0_g1_i2.p1 TRINITY_DN5365_c0_g1~~TRINITY_DN5365_c0_g1_i2.p1  ORF type:complete len:181 (+),score=32.51 TRINITY_DN5365_c0_g1_i2:92-634(+)